MDNHNYGKMEESDEEIDGYGDGWYGDDTMEVGGGAVEQKVEEESEADSGAVEMEEDADAGDSEDEFVGGDYYCDGDEAGYEAERESEEPPQLFWRRRGNGYGYGNYNGYDSDENGNGNEKEEEVEDVVEESVVGGRAGNDTEMKDNYNG